MSTLTGKDLNLVKPALTDDHKVTIGTDLPANFQKIDDEFTAHLADDVTDGVHGMGSIASQDYEEGTWTPYIGGNYVGTYSEQYGQYTKIGKRVFCDFILTVEEKTSGSHALIIQGMPFARTSTQGHLIPLTVFGVDLTDYIETFGVLTTSGSFFIIVYFVKSDGTSITRVTSVVETGTTVRGSFSYLTP